MTKNLIISALISICVLSVSCSSSESIESPTISIQNTEYSTPFYTTGQTESPTIDWNGDVGNLSINNTSTSISLNSTSGVISWSKSLPLGMNSIILTATNSEGQNTTNIVIENFFNGEFTGGYNSDPNSVVLDTDIKMGFDLDGMDVLDGGAEGTLSTQGSWTRNDNEVTAVYSFDNGATFLTAVMNITYNETEANIEGFLYNGSDASGNPTGYIRLDLNSVL